MILKFRVYEQTISLQSTKSEPRQGSRDYLELQFSFSSDWNDLLKYVYIQHGEVSVPHDLVEGSVIVDEYFTEQTEFNVTLFGKSADGSIEVPTNVITVFLKESNNLWVKDAPEPQNSWVVQVVDARDEALAAAIRAENAAIRQPYPNSETGTWWVWNAEAEAYQDTGISCGGFGDGTNDHSKLKNRDAAGQHPMSAITGLEEALEGKQPTGSYLTDKDLDATLTVNGKAADAAAVGARLSSLSEDIVTTSESKVAAHNTGTDTHSDIRLLIQGLSERLSAVADSDDTTLDQLSEIVAYIKSNRDLIASITTDKVSVADIVDNLTTNVANKPLSAAQGVALKALIDAITIPEALPNPNALTFTGAVTGTYDGSEALSVEIPSGGGGSDWELIAEITSDGAGTNSGLFAPISFNSYKELHLEATSIADSSITFRLMLSKTTNWYDGQVIASGATTNAVAYMAHFWIMDGYIKVISGRNSGYSDAKNDGTCKFVNNPRYAFATSDYAYIRFDANNSVVPEGATLKIWGV